MQGDDSCGIKKWYKEINRMSYCMLFLLLHKKKKKNSSKATWQMGNVPENLFYAKKHGSL